MRIMVGMEAMLRRSTRAVHRDLADGGGGVILNLDSGAYYALNPVGLLIWTLLEDDMTFGALLGRVRQELSEAPPGQELEQDLRAFLQQLQERDLVVIADEPGS